ncbi:AraC family transcriptional regulator [Bordetella flabilis]|uniref:AraC family transcriptional regulator n=1 Tax=Bordetella flabilis TaxID=463014 RepID=A0A193GCQ8_9BORD|nr:helix-turn-helix transcriptional regulator [Bordetella flabilis]ANN77241.1 AraC family transcriptional regulator [Bordetella flabilis]
MDSIWRERFAKGYRRLERPVMAARHDYEPGHREIWHSHEQGQLVHAIQGVVRVLTPQGAWAIAPRQALWIAPGVDHELHMVGHVAMRWLRIEPDAAPWLWPECRHIRVNPLLRELILAMLDDPPVYDADSKAAMIVPLLLRHLCEAEEIVHGKLPLPQDKRLRKVCETLMRAPATHDSMTLLSERAGTSVRTLGRLFKQETGLTFGQWRQQLRLSEAVCQLSLGQSVSSVAQDMGYGTVNAFSAMFRRALGEAPQRYLRETRG